MTDDYTKYVKKAVAGDKHAFGELYKIFLDKIYRFVFYLINDEFLAEDITQNTFLKAWRGLSRFSVEKGTFQSFLYTIARNNVIDVQRKKKETSIEAFGENGLESPENLEAKIWRDESIERVRKALSILKERERQIIILRYFEDLSFEEIAKILGVSSGSLRVKVHRILRILKKNLE